MSISMTFGCENLSIALHYTQYTPPASSPLWATRAGNTAPGSRRPHPLHPPLPPPEGIVGIPCGPREGGGGGFPYCACWLSGGMVTRWSSTGVTRRRRQRTPIRRPSGWIRSSTLRIYGERATTTGAGRQGRGCCQADGAPRRPRHLVGLWRSSRLARRRL
jgi:hypothetical protein